MSPRATRLRAVLFMVIACVAWSGAGLTVRLMSLSDPWEIVFWRSFFMMLFLAGVLLTRYGRDTAARIAAVGRAGAAAGSFLSLTFVFFIIALSMTTVANTLVIMSVSPFITALLGRWLLRERIAGQAYAAMAVALVGITIMFWDSLQSGGVLGTLIALGVPLSFSANLLVLRRAGTSVDMVPTVFIAGVISCAMTLPLAWPFNVTQMDLALLAFMGCGQLGLGCLLMTIATRHLSAAEVSLLGLLEITMGPIWVWLGTGERPSDLAMVGGLIVLAALAGNELMARRRTGVVPIA
jgi:drug/metabolite transporter (DMT)-like permease